MIDVYAWISNLLLDSALTWQPGWLKSDLFSGLISGNLSICTVLVSLYCFWVPREIKLRFCSKIQWQIFLHVGFRPLCWCPSGWAPTWRLHTNLYKFGGKASPLLRILLHKKNCYDPNLGESLCMVTFFLFWDSGLNLLNGFDFYFDLQSNLP